MGWLFGKKKVPKIPFPEEQVVDETAWRFMGGSSAERVIEPEHTNHAPLFGIPRMPSFSSDRKEVSQKSANPFQRSFSPPSMSNEPLFVKMEVYQRILGEMDSLKLALSKLGDISRHLESSEYNEESHFDILRREVKLAHDKLLQVDKLLFKSQGD